MSTKFTIKDHEDMQGGFHLYDDWLDEAADIDVVHLRLDGVHFTASSPGTVEIAIPRDWAVKLGLLPEPTKESDDAETG